MTGPELCGPWTWLVGSVNLRRAGRLPLLGLGREARVSWVLVDLGSETLRLQPPPASDLPRISGQNSAEIDLKLKNRGWS